MGAHEANLRGELALEQIRAMQDATFPGLQGDLERGRVREIAEVQIVEIEDPLTRDGAAYGIRSSPDRPAAPIAPNVIGLPGRYRAWVLPTCGVAVALEPLDDEVSYLRGHRARLLAEEGARDEDLLRLPARAPETSVPKTFWQRFRLPNIPYDGVLKKKAAHTLHVSLDTGRGALVTARVFALLVIGVRYCLRKRRGGGHVFEPVLPEEAVANVGPYR